MTTRSVGDWEQRFNSWSKGPGITEQERCENAERMVRDAICVHPAFKNRNMRVFLQGSYRNRTNVRMDSDIDVCVQCLDTVYFTFDHAPGLTMEALGFSPSTYHFAELKQDVEDALVARFGRRYVDPGNKAFNISENTYRVTADVVPTFEHRAYFRDNLGNVSYASGTVLEDNCTGRLIYNWPDQHHRNGIRKREETSRQFKKKVRILKNLCNEMVEAGLPNAAKMASFLLECLVYNCSFNAFNQPTHYDDIRAVILESWNATRSDQTAATMLEVNELKYLFHYAQPWDRTTVHAFLLEALDYVGFKS